MRVIILLLLTLVGANSLADNIDETRIKSEVAAFFVDYLKPYNNYFANPKDPRHAMALAENFHLPLLQAPPLNAPRVQTEKEQLAKGLEAFVAQVAKKGVKKLAYTKVQLHVLGANKVLADNLAYGYADDGKVVYETAAVYLLHRTEGGWKIAMLSPHAPENTLVFPAGM